MLNEIVFPLRDYDPAPFYFLYIYKYITASRTVLGKLNTSEYSPTFNKTLFLFKHFESQSSHWRLILFLTLPKFNTWHMQMYKFTFNLCIKCTIKVNA